VTENQKRGGSYAVSLYFYRRLNRDHAGSGDKKKEKGEKKEKGKVHLSLSLPISKPACKFWEGEERKEVPPSSHPGFPLREVGSVPPGERRGGVREGIVLPHPKGPVPQRSVH